MTLYHGSDVPVERPAIIRQNRFLDFGFGFYTTTNRDQAVAFAHKTAQRRKSPTAVVSVYHVDENVAFRECRVLRFDSADERWLEFVAQNRAGSYSGPEYDLIFGAVANDDVYRTLTLYTTGVLSHQQTIEALKVRRLYNQLVFASEHSLSYLRFVQKELV